MSSAGIPQSGLSGVLNLVRPDLAAEQMALQRRQAFAQSLLAQQPQYAGVGGALDNVGSKLLGAFLSKNADKQNLDIANKYRDALFNPQGAGGSSAALQPQPDSPPLGSLPQNVIPPSPGQPNSAVSQSNLPPLGSMPQGGLQAPNPQQGSSTMQPSPQAQQKPQAQSLFDQSVPDIQGIDPRNKFVLYASDPANYMKAYYTSVGLTDAEKNAADAFGRGTAEYQQSMQGAVNKSGAIQVTRGVTILPDGRQVYAPPPAPAGSHYTTGPDGQPQIVQTPGGLEAEGALSATQAAGKAEYRPEVGYVPGPNGQMMPTATNAAIMSGHGAAPAPNPTPSAAPFGAPIGESIVKGLFPGAIITSGQRSTQHNADVGGVPNSMHIPGSAVDFVLPQGKSFADVKQAFTQSGLPASELIDEGSHIHWGWGDKPSAQGSPGSSAPMPELPPGYKSGSEAFNSGVAKTASDEYNQTHSMAADVPTRLNVLQSVLQLSHNGAPTGSTEWMNDARHTAAALSQALGHPVDANNPAALMGEIHKYMGQYSNRMAQGQGGTGTDKQLEAVEAANPNSEMFASTLQRVVPWIMANEKGIAAKANFLDQYPGASNNPQAAVNAQKDWRNLYTPRIAQFEMLNPQQQAGYLRDPKAFKDANDRKTFIESALKLHPFFQGQPQ